MGTHCYIAKEVGPDQYRTIFCQLDGYLEEVGAKLATHYDTEKQVDKLLNLGDVYSLRAKLNPDPSLPHEPKNTQKDVSVFYGRDYGESGMEATIKKMEDFEDNDDWCEFLYVFKPQEGWSFLQYGQYDELRNLKETLDQYDINYRPEVQSQETEPEQSDNGEEETYEQKM